MEFKDVWLKYLVYGNWKVRHPDGRIGKDVVVCHSNLQAKRVAYNMCKDNTTHLKIRYIANRRNMPRFNPDKYIVTWRRAEDCPLWNK